MFFNESSCFRSSSINSLHRNGDLIIMNSINYKTTPLIVIVTNSMFYFGIASN